MIDLRAVPELLRHEKRPEWGLGVLVERDGERLRYRFADGETRTFGPAAFAMLEAAAASEEERRALLHPKRGKAAAKAPGKPADGGGEASAAPAARAPEAPAARAPEAPAKLTLDGQIAAFRRLFPGGFEDAAFVERHRGVPGGRKAWQLASVELCRAQLEQEALRAALLAGGKGTFARVKKVAARARAFLGDAEVPALAALEDGSPAELRFTEALYALLHGAGDAAAAFERLVASMPPPARTWGLATLAAGLFDAQKHVLVHAIATPRQADVLGHRAALLARPSGEGYAFARKLSDEVRARLEAAGLAPRDRLDVLSFSLATL